MAFVVDSIVQVVGSIINKIIPDPQAQVQAQLQLLQLQQAGEFKEIDARLAEMTAQTDINKIEAANASVFVSGWRPFMGWVCGFAFATKYLFGPLLLILATYAGHPFEMPKIDMTDMLPILGGMLGLGALRSYEKVKGAA